MGSEMKHTPGPWVVDDQPMSELRIGVVSDRDVETDYGLVAREFFYEVATVADNEDGDANARLIAAAPDLLEALNGMVELCQHANPGAFSNGVTDSTGTIDEGDVIASRIIGEARAALAKAEGKQ